MELERALLAKEYPTIERLKEKFSKWLLMADPHLVEIVVATVVANRMGGDPLWMLLVAPPSSAKTELIRSLSLLSDVHLLSNLTPNTLLSGMKGKKDASLESTAISRSSGRNSRNGY